MLKCYCFSTSKTINTPFIQKIAETISRKHQQEKYEERGQEGEQTEDCTLVGFHSDLCV